MQSYWIYKIIPINQLTHVFGVTMYKVKDCSFKKSRYAQNNVIPKKLIQLKSNKNSWIQSIDSKQ